MTSNSELSRIASLLSAIAKQLDTITRHIMPVAPNYRHPLKRYWQFDWEGIDAIVLQRDEEGVSVVKWGNYTWKRRSGSGKFGKAIWFSRPDGKDENGDTRYRRLVTFKDWSDPEPVDTRAASANGSHAAPESVRPAPSRPIVQANGHTNTVSAMATVANTAPVAWEQFARQTTDPTLFDKCFFNANPQWNNFGMVTRVRQFIGELTLLGGDTMYDALTVYADDYRQQRKMMSAESAHALALQTAWDALPTVVTPIDPPQPETAPASA